MSNSVVRLSNKLHLNYFNYISFKNNNIIKKKQLSRNGYFYVQIATENVETFIKNNRLQPKFLTIFDHSFEKGMPFSYWQIQTGYWDDCN